MKRVSQPISNIKKAFSLASLIHIAYHPENPHDFTLQLCLPSALFFSHGKEMQCFTDTIKTVQASTPLWLLNNWMLCLGILMEGIFIGVCVCLGMQKNLKISNSQGKTLTSDLRWSAYPSTGRHRVEKLGWSTDTTALLQSLVSCLQMQQFNMQFLY